ncbi:hypothetical protein DRQ27_05950 [bacterium]|nr:MAG: hypothetical protein DRQ27_05950 [bacterium]
MYVTSIIEDPYGDYGEISAYDITDPSRALSVDGLCFLSCPLFRVTNHGQTWLLAVSGMDDSLAIVRSMRVGVIDEELLTSPDTFFIALDSHPSALKVHDNYAVCVAKDDISIVNITSPKNPTLEFIHYENGGYDIDISGNYAFITTGLANFSGSGRHGLLVLKIDSLPAFSLMSTTESAYHKSIPGEVQVEGNIAYTFSFDTVVVRIDTVSGDTVKYMLGFLDAFDITKVSMHDSVKWLSGDTMLYSKDTFNIIRILGLNCPNDKYPIAYGELEVEGDTVYVSWRCMPFGPLYTTDSAVYCAADNHIGFFDITNPESVTAFVPWQFVDTTDAFRHIDSCRHNLGYATGLCSFGGALDVEGNILYSTIGNTEWYGFPISRHDSVAFGVFSYNIERTVGDFIYDIDWGRKRWLSTVDSFFFISHNYYPLDLLVDGDFAFCSSGSLNASHSDGIWLLDVRDSILSGWYIPIEPDSNIRSKFNGFDIAGDYLYSVGYSKDLPYTRFWSIKVYQRNHNTTPYPKNYSNHNRRKTKSGKNPVDVSLGYSNGIVKIKLGVRGNLDNCVVDIFDLSGRVVGSRVFRGLKEGQVVEVNTIDLSTGIYFVSVRADGSKMVRKLLIVK